MISMGPNPCCNNTFVDTKVVPQMITTMAVMI